MIIFIIIIIINIIIIVIIIFIYWVSRFFDSHLICIMQC